MAVNVEREPQAKIPEGIVEVPESFPEKIEKTGVTVRPTQFTQKVQDDQGQNLIHTPATKAITIQLPATQQQLTSWSKGSANNSITWLGMFWLRMIKKALHFGWKTIGKKEVGGE